VWLQTRARDLPPNAASYHLPATLPDNSIMIVIVVSVWIVVFA